MGPRFLPADHRNQSGAAVTLFAPQKFKKTRIAALPLAPAARQGCGAPRASVLRTPLSRGGFAVAGVSDSEVEQKVNI